MSTGYIFAGLGQASLSFTTCLSHDMDVGGTGQTTNYANSLQIPELALSHLSCSALTLTSLGSTGHIDVYNTVSSDFTLMSSACVTMITTDLVFLANDQSFFPCLIVQAVNSVDYQNNTSIVTSSVILISCLHLVLHVS